MAASEFRTIREAGVAIDGIFRQLTLVLWVLGGSAALGVAVAGALYVKLDSSAVALAGVEGKLEAVREQLSALNARLDRTLAPRSQNDLK
jgi:hypothetical protein